MGRRPWTLRSMLMMVMLLVTVLALVVSSALVVLTTTIERTTEHIGQSVESVRLAEEAEIDLLLHARRRDTLLGHDLEGNLRRKVQTLHDHVGTAEEARLLAAVDTSVDAYLTAARNPAVSAAELEPLHAAAFGALEALTNLNVQESRASREAAASAKRLGNVLGIGSGVLLLGVMALVVIWMRWRAFRPLFALAEVMSRFGRGDREVRAREEGAAELQQMSARFNELAEAVEAQRRSQISFLGGVAHDLRDPLSVLSLSMQMLAMDASPHQRALLESSTRQITRLERMVGDFLNLAKVEAGELELVLQIEDLRRLVNEVVELRRGTAAHHRLVVSMPGEPVYVRCDALRIEQVITNLISNAIKYSPTDSPIEIEVAVQGGEAILRVVDHGIGITEDDQRELFQPFRRVGNARATAPGVGLGLWVSQRITQAHGGRIEVTSTPGHGSAFALHVPHFEGVTAGQAAARERDPFSVH